METHFEAKLDLVIDLLNDNNINIHKLLDSYQDTQLLRRILELDTTILKHHHPIIKQF